MRAASASFILCDPKDDVILPGDGAWSQFECCKTRSSACLMSLCPNYTVPELVPWETFHRLYTPERLKQLRTDRKVLLDVYELDPYKRVKPGTPVTADDELHILDPLRWKVSGIIHGVRQAWVEKSIVIVPDTGHHHASPTKARGAGLFCDVPLMGHPPPKGDVFSTSPPMPCEYSRVFLTMASTSAAGFCCTTVASISAGLNVKLMAPFLEKSFPVFAQKNLARKMKRLAMGARDDAERERRRGLHLETLAAKRE